MDNKALPDYSIVIPVYFNEANLDETMAIIRNDVIVANPGLRGEVIFVDDGSGDGSLASLLRLREADPGTIRVIKLTRNFGQVHATRAGLEHARGQCVVVMSADGQDPAALINDMLKAHTEEGYDVVICAREDREESIWRILTSKLFYWLMRKLSFANMPSGGFDFVSLSRRALTTFLCNREAHPFFQGQILSMGYKPKIIYYRRRDRSGGKSRWTFGKKLTYLIDGVMSYSYLPLRLMSLAGIAFAFLGFCYAIVIVLLKCFGNVPFKGWAPLMILILVMGGIQMLMIGIVGEYLWRTLAQTRQRDPYVIDRIYE